MNDANHRTSTDHLPTGGGTAATITRPAAGTATPSPGRSPRWAPFVAAAGAVLVVGAGVLVVDAITESSTSTPVEFTTSQRLVQDSIDEALAERSSVESPSTGTPPQRGPNADLAPDWRVAAQTVNQGPNADLAPDGAATTQAANGSFTPIVLQGSSQQLVQDSIDAALAANGSFTPIVLQGSSQQLVQDSIDAALAANAVPAPAATGAVLRPGMPDGYWQPTNEAAAVSDGSHERAEANRMDTLRNLNGADLVSDGSYERAEVNRMDTLRNLNGAYTPECNFSGPC